MPITTRKKSPGKGKHRRKPADSLSVKVKPKASGACRTKNRKARP